MSIAILKQNAEILLEVAQNYEKLLNKKRFGYFSKVFLIKFFIPDSQVLIGKPLGKQR